MLSHPRAKCFYTPGKAPAANYSMIEPLEKRQLLSAGPGGPGGPNGHPGGGGPGGAGGPPPQDGPHNGPPVATIEFDLAPTAVQDGLTDAAADEGVTAPTADDLIYLGNTNGTQTYTFIVDEAPDDTDAVTKLTVDVNGVVVTPPAHDESTFGDIADSAASDALTAIAAALGADAPADDDVIQVLETSTGKTYTMEITPSTSDDADHPTHPIRVTVDTDGNPVGNGRLPLSVMPDAVKAALIANAPDDAEVLTDDSLIDIRTVDGVTLYTAHYSSEGVETIVTVNLAGELTSKPASEKVEFSTLSSTVQDALQTLATAKGYTDTIADDQEVTALHEANGTTIYTVRLKSEDVSSDESSEEYELITVSVDQDGNATVPPMGAQGGPGGRGPGGDNQAPPPVDQQTAPPVSDDDSTGTPADCPPAGGSGDDSSDSTDDGSSTTTGSGTTAASTDSSSSDDSTTPLTKAEKKAAKKAAKLAKKEAAKAEKAAAKAEKLAAKQAAKLAKAAAKVSAVA